MRMPWPWMKKTSLHRRSHLNTRLSSGLSSSTPLLLPMRKRLEQPPLHSQGEPRLIRSATFSTLPHPLLSLQILWTRPSLMPLPKLHYQTQTRSSCTLPRHLHQKRALIQKCLNPTAFRSWDYPQHHPSSARHHSYPTAPALALLIPHRNLVRPNRSLILP